MKLNKKFWKIFGNCGEIFSQKFGKAHFSSMFFLYLLTILNYKFSSKLRPYTKYQLPEYYHFKSSGEYSIEIDSSKQSKFPIEIDFFVCKKSEFRKFYKKDHFNCTIYHNIIVESNESTYKLSGTISKKGAYQILFFPIKNVIDSEILIKLRNPNSYLDSFILPSIYWEPTYASLLSLFLLLWLINSIMYFGNCRLFILSMHNLLTKSYLLILLSSILIINELWKSHLHDKTQPYHNLTIASLFFQYLIVSYSMLIASTGLSILTEKVSFSTKIKFLCFSLLLTLPPTILINTKVASTNWRFFFYFVIIVGIYVFHDQMTTYSNKTIQGFVVYLYAIGKAGFHPVTTPVYREYLLFDSVFNCILMVFFFGVFLFAIWLLFGLNFTVRLILHDLILLMFAVPMGFYYRYRKGMRNGYSRIGDYDNGREPMRVLASDIAKINLSTFEMEGDDDSQRERVDWENGMILPPRPIIVTSNENQSRDENESANNNEDEERNDKENENDENKENEKVEDNNDTNENADNNDNIDNNQDDKNEPIIENIKLDT